MPVSITPTTVRIEPTLPSAETPASAQATSAPVPKALLTGPIVSVDGPSIPHRLPLR